MQDVSIKPIFSLITASFLALSGCSDSSSSDQTPEPVTQSQNLNGEAVKGILASAPVTAFSLDRGTTYGSTQTAADGTYSLNGLSLGSGPVLVELTTDSDTLMTCDSAMGCTFDGTTYDFGADFVFDDPDFVLTAILPGVASDATDARLMVTPVTHMAAQRAIASGATTAEAIEGVNRATARLLGLDNVDITSLAPSDITSTDSGSDDSAAQKYGALVAAFATLAEASGGDIEAALRQIVDDYAQDGGMKANTTVEGELALANIFGAAQQSAEKAQQSGINLGNTGAALALETLEAESAPADSVITPDDEEEIPSALMTEEEATEAGIALLNDLNNWYQALSNADVDTKGDMYAAQIEAAADLLPAFDGLSEELDNLQKLVISTEVQCLDAYSYYNFDLEQVVSGCNEYGDVVIPGPLTFSFPVISSLGQYAQYIEKNHANLAFTDNEDGTYSLSTDDLGDSLAGLDIAEILSDEEGNMAEGAAIEATYAFNDDKLATISFFGTGSELNIASSESPLTLSYAQNGAVISYSITGLIITPVDTETATFTEVSMPAVSADITFDTEISAAAFIPAIDNDGNINPATIVSVAVTASGEAEGESGVASFDFNATLTSPTSSTRALLVGISFDSDKDNDGTADISGVLNIAVAGDYAQQGDMFSGYDVTFSNATVTAEFAGHAEATLENGNSVSIDGSLSTEITGISSGDVVTAEAGEAEFNGSLVITDASGDAPVVTGFTGLARLKLTAIMTPADEILIIDGEPVVHPYEAYISGELSTDDSENMASVSLSGLVRIDNLDNLRVASPSLPVKYSTFPVTVEVTTIDEDTLSFDWSGVPTQIENALGNGFTIDYDQWNYRTQLSSFRRELVGANPEFEDPGYYSFFADPYGYEMELGYMNYDGYDHSGPVATDSIQTALIHAVDSYYLTFNFGYYLQNEIASVSVSDRNSVVFDESGNLVITAIIGSAQLDKMDLIDAAETSDIYREVSVAINVDATATGLDEAAIRILAQRTGLEDVSGSVQLSYNSADASVKRVIDLQLNSAQDITNGEFNYLTVADADTEMTIQATCVSDEETADCDEFEFTGIITVAGHQVGVLESRDGVPVFKFGNEDRYRILTPNFLVEKVVD